MLMQLTDEQVIQGTRRRVQRAVEKLAEAQVELTQALSSLMYLEEKCRREEKSGSSPEYEVFNHSFQGEAAAGPE